MKVNILAIMAHPDDAELCCGGLLLTHKNLGYTIGVIDLTAGELGSRGTEHTRKEEAKEASEILGLTVRENLGLPDGSFDLSIDSKMPIVNAVRKYQPDIVITNATKDRHPDHGRACQLVTEACFLSGLLKIETFNDNKPQDIWRPKTVLHAVQDRYINPDFVVDVSDVWDIKMKSIAAYKTQFNNKDNEGPKTPISGNDFWQFLEARGREMGRNISVEYAEGFVSSRIFGVTDLTKLI